GLLYGTRLRDPAHAAAPIVVKTKLPKLSIPYALEAVAFDGYVIAVANLGTGSGNALSMTGLRPGLAVKVSHVKKKVFARVRDDTSEARRGEAPGRFPDLRTRGARQAALVSRLRRECAEAAAGARRSSGLLRNLVRERPPRRLPPRRAGHGRLRGRSRDDRK